MLAHLKMVQSEGVYKREDTNLQTLLPKKPNLSGMGRGGGAQDSQMDWMRGRTDGPADYIRIEDRPRYLLLFLAK